MNRLEALAQELMADQDPRYKDDWERGYDAGRQAAGRELANALGKE